MEVLFQSGLEQYKESQSKPDETEPVPSTVSTEVFDNYGYHGYHLCTFFCMSVDLSFCELLFYLRIETIDMIRERD